MKLTKTSLLIIALLLASVIALAIYISGILGGGDTGRNQTAAPTEISSAEFQEVCRPQDLSPSTLRIGSWSVHPDSIKQVSWRAADSAMTDVMIALTKEGQERLSSETSANIGKSLALSIDGKMMSEPVIREAIRGKQILVQLPAGSDISVEILKAIAPDCTK